MAGLLAMFAVVVLAGAQECDKEPHCKADGYSFPHRLTAPRLSRRTAFAPGPCQEHVLAQERG